MHCGKLLDTYIATWQTSLWWLYPVTDIHNCRALGSHLVSTSQTADRWFLDILSWSISVITGNCNLVVQRIRQQTGETVSSVAASRAWNWLPTELWHLIVSFKTTENSSYSFCVTNEHLINFHVMHSHSYCRERSRSVFVYCIVMFCICCAGKWGCSEYRGWSQGTPSVATWRAACHPCWNAVSPRCRYDSRPIRRARFKPRQHPARHLPQLHHAE